MIGSTVQRKIALSAHGVESQALEPEQGTATDSVTKPLEMRKRGNSLRPSPFFFV